MNRPNLMDRIQAINGDLTTTGASCENHKVNGIPILRLEDRTTPCPKCGKEGFISEGINFIQSNGKPVVPEGALVICGRPQGFNRVVVASEPMQSAISTSSDTQNPIAKITIINLVR